MLPHINTKDGHFTSHDWVLVLSSNDAQTLSILDEPSPATTLKAEKGLLESILEGLDAAPRFGDLGAQCGSAVGLGVGRA